MIPPEVQQAEIAAANSLGFLAADFCTEPETWPVFQAWLKSKCRGHAFPDVAAPYLKDTLVENLRLRGGAP